jgi:predicted transcriptional regulator
MDTDGRATTHEHAAFLAGSSNRVRVLRALRERPGRGAELAERCSLPRSTVHRCLDGFTTRGWARKSGGDHRLTAAGALVLGAYEDLIGTVSITGDYEEFLRHLGEVARTLPVGTLPESTVVEATPENPHATVEHYEQVFAAVAPKRMRGIVPIVSHVFNEASRPLVEGGVEMGVVIDEAVLDTAREAYPAAHELGVESENFTIYVHPEAVSFGLAVFDDERVLVGAYDDAGNPRACLDGTDDALVDWAIGTYERYRREARRLGAGTEAETVVEAP